MPSVRGYGSKIDLVLRYTRQRRVLHLGAVGETCMDTEVRVARAANSVHAQITEVASDCVGVDNDEASVTLLTERGIFSNLLLADVTTLSRSQIKLDTVDVVVAGDIIEHLTEPGRLLEMIDKIAEPSTILILSTLNALGLGIFVSNVMGKPIESRDHVCSFNSYTLSNMLERYDWQVDELWTCHQPKAAALNPRTFRLGKMLLERVPRLGGTLFAVCSRTTN